MEAPEKIYLVPLPSGRFDREWFVNTIHRDDTEYTRTDAFIEKAAEWILSNIEDYIHVEYDTATGRPTNEAHIARKKVIEDFKNAMKL